MLSSCRTRLLKMCRVLLTIDIDKPPSFFVMDYKPSIVSNVRSAIDSMNNIVVLLQTEEPISSDIMEISYPQGTVDEFLKSSKVVIDVSNICYADAT